MFRKLLETIKDNTLKITILKDSVDIVNYKTIISFDDNKIVVDCKTEIITVFGNDLIINKMLDDEVLIVGRIKKIEID